jgi:hypothetical protein
MFSVSTDTGGAGTGRDTPLALSILLLATSAVCGVYGGDHSGRPTVIAIVTARMIRRIFV